MAAKRKPQQPMLFLGGLSGRVYVATKYHQDHKGAGDNPQPVFVADEKFDITEQFEDIALQRGRARRKTPKPRTPPATT